MDINEISRLNFEGKRQILKKYLIEEAYIDYILVALERSRSTKDTALIIAEQAIPYVLHINMHITEKFVSLLL